jgi:hypothetical protein
MMIRTDLKPPTPPGAELLALQHTLPAAQPSALQQAQTLGTLFSQSLARSTGNGIATAAVLPLAGRMETWAELLNLQENIEVGYGYWVAQQVRPTAGQD